MIEWWNSLSLAAQIFACMAIPSTLILLIQTILMLIGFGEHEGGGSIFGEGDVDGPDETPFLDFTGGDDIGDGTYGDTALEVDHDVSGLEGLRILSVRGIVAFFVVFGWVGVVLEGTNMPIIADIAIAFVCGLLVMVLIAFLMRAAMKLQSNGAIDIRNALGCSGTVYLTVPEKRSGEGKVNVTVQGQYGEYSCVTDSEEPLKTGSEVVVVGISSQTKLVVKKK